MSSVTTSANVSARSRFRALHAFPAQRRLRSHDMEVDRGSGLRSQAPILCAMGDSGKTKIENDVDVLRQNTFTHGPDALGAAPAALRPPVEDHGLRRFVAKQLHHPFIEREAQRPMLTREPARQCRLAGAEGPADHVDGRHARQLTPAREPRPQLEPHSARTCHA